MENRVKQMKNRAGFTLVELIAVMAILAILLMAAVPRMSNYIKAAHRTAAITEAQIAADAVQRYLDDEMAQGGIKGSKVWPLMGLDLSNPDGVLKDYISGGQKDARINKVNVDMSTGRLLGIVYETKYSKVTMTIDEDGNRTLEEEEKN